MNAAVPSLALPRVEGPAKVCGVARYASDLFFPGEAHAALVTAPTGPGRLTELDAGAAAAAPDVLLVLTHRELADRIAPVPHLMAGGYVNSSFRPMQSARVAYPGQIVALVVANTRDAALHAASLVRVSVAADGVPAPSLDSPGATVVPLAGRKPDHEDPRAGDFDAAWAAAPHRVDLRLATPIQHHNPLELFTTACRWDADGTLQVHEPTRFLDAARAGLAAQLGLAPERVRIRAPLIGGHFGSRLALSQYTAPVAIAARMLGRPVSLVPTRTQCFTIQNHRPDTAHHLRLAADATGRFLALSHAAVMSTSRFDFFAMEGTDVTARLYRCPAIHTREDAAETDRNTPGPMRAPPELPFLFALESAVDEMAADLRLDPIELRRRNDTATDPVDGKPFSTRPLMRCFDAGARAFGWDRRDPVPGAMRDGDTLVGWGCASAVRPVKIGPAAVRLSLRSDGTARIGCAQHEIGNGITTVLAILVGAALGLDPGAVTVELGDTALSPAGISGGSSTTTSLAHAAEQACAELLRRLPERAGATPRQRLALTGRDAIAVDTVFVPPGAPPDAAERLREGRLALSTSANGPAWAWGAQFAEVRIDRRTGEVRVGRLLGAFAAGRIIDPLTARSQLLGGMVFGLGAALLEATVPDRRTGRYTNADLAEYLLPTGADAPPTEVLLLPDDDARVNPLGLKGLGELGTIGVNAAIANAVRHATGRRITRLPVRVEDLL